jgi:hypothetical protein
MKISVTLKDPDTFYEAVRDAVTEDVRALKLPADESKAMAEIRRTKAFQAIERWVDYGEYVTIDFDTEAGTATVREKKS